MVTLAPWHRGQRVDWSTVDGPEMARGEELAREAVATSWPEPVGSAVAQPDWQLTAWQIVAQDEVGGDDFDEEDFDDDFDIDFDDEVDEDLAEFERELDADDPSTMPDDGEFGDSDDEDSCAAGEDFE